MGISDHGPASALGLGVASLGVFRRTRREIERLRPRYPALDIRLGVEANVTSCAGDIDIPPAWFALFDYVQLGLHSWVTPLRWRDALELGALNLAARWSDRLARRARARNTAALVQAIARYPIDVVTHPGFQLQVDMVAVAEACARTGAAFEINTGHGRPAPAQLRAVACTGVNFVIGSDAHTPARVGDLALGVALARAAGIPPERLLNVSEYTAGRSRSGIGEARRRGWPQ